MNISWEKIVNGTLQTLITTIIIGAAIIVWNGATSVDKKVTAATSSLQQTIDYTKKAVELLETELVQIKGQNSNLVVAIQELRTSLSNETQRSPQIQLAPPLPPSWETNWMNPKTILLQSNVPEEGKVHRPHTAVDVSQLPPVEKNYIMRQLPQLPVTSKE